jgi:hypothetical protein
LLCYCSPAISALEVRGGEGSQGGNFNPPLDRLEARLVAQRIHERVGLQPHKTRVTHPHGPPHVAKHKTPAQISAERILFIRI